MTWYDKVLLFFAIAVIMVETPALLAKFLLARHPDVRLDALVPLCRRSGLILAVPVAMVVMIIIAYGG